MHPQRIVSLLLAALAAPAAAQDVIFEIGSAGLPPAGFLRGLGDVDGDGHADFGFGAIDVAGAPGYAVMSGQTGLPLSVHTIGTSFPQRAFDLDQDGVLDMLMWPSPWGQAHVRVRSGATGQWLVNVAEPPGVQSFGATIEFADDWDGDGRVDLAVAAPLEDVFVNGVSVYGVGRMFVLSGRTSEILLEFDPAEPTTKFGSSIAVVDDVDGDGLRDLAIGSAGQAGVYSYRTGARLLDLGDDAASGFGLVAAIGDVDGDGYTDVMVGAPQDAHGDQAGYVRVFSGKTGALLHHVTGEPGDRLGTAVAGPGDLDGDGVPDFVAAAPQEGFGSFQEPGAIRCYSGVDGSPLFALHGSDPATSFGFYVAAAGDVDLDGHGDLLVPDFDSTGVAVRVYSGADLGVTTDTHAISLVAGGEQSLEVDCGAAHAGAIYLVLGTMSGVQSGLALGSHVLPLVPDAWFLFTLAHPNTVLADSLGQLDGAGRATVTITLPPTANSVLAGLTFHHAAIVFASGLGASVADVTNAVPLTFVD
ncbi:MAG: integrin alpha [Planctomycetota bacterium]